MTENVIPFNQVRRALTIPSSEHERYQIIGRSFEGRFVCIAEWNRWMYWDGHSWQEDANDKLTIRAVNDAQRALSQELSNQANVTDFQEKLCKFENFDHAKAKKTKEGVSCEQFISLNELEKKPHLLTVNNGTLNLITGELYPSDPGDYLCNRVEVNYDSKAECPRWESFLCRVLPDREVRAFFKRMVGYCLTGDISAQKFFYLYGDGANGKSTAMDVVRALLSRYFSIGDDSLIVKGREEHQTVYASLHGKRLMLFPEVHENAKFDEGSVKKLVGEQTVKARRMREDEWEFDATHKMVLCGNHKMEIRGTDGGIWRRVVMIHFSQVIPEDERDPKLNEKLTLELPGILKWAAEGAAEFYDVGLRIPDVIKRDTEEYRGENDWFGNALDEKFVIDPDKKILRSILLEKINDWCNENVHQKISGRNLFSLMRKKGFVEIKSHGDRYFVGLEAKGIMGGDYDR